MAQLRDVETGELLAEGTPVEIAAIAAELGIDEVLFDGVGLAFDHAAVLEANDREIAGLEAAGAETDAQLREDGRIDEETGRETRERAREHATELRATRSSAVVRAREARALLDQARDRRREAQQRERR